MPTIRKFIGRALIASLIVYAISVTVGVAVAMRSGDFFANKYCETIGTSISASCDNQDADNASNY